jgi:Aspartyl/Asparaginyl beta-hydroxylase
MATPAEEIAQQHEKAQQLLTVMPCASPSSHEEIPLSMKTRPTIDLISSEEEEEEKKAGDEIEIQGSRNIVAWSSRGRVDVSKLQALVQEGYRIAEHTPPVKKKSETATKGNATATQSKRSTTNKKTTATQTKAQQSRFVGPQYLASDVKSATNLWDPINAAVHNVNIVRPSHDAWGIGKIVLIFADDFLKNIYELPWWHLRQDVRDAVQPILDTLGIQSNQIVRILLASLPPGTTIPVHHDTGAWVSRTHRVHVPILVQEPEKVLFRVGLTGKHLLRIDCTPGHVFEMNNQCRHAVSNCSDDYRVHLILDYTDGPANERIILDPGERLLQTRRSVDRLQNQGSRPTPSFLILGAQKAGTTSLYEYMMQHPLIVRPNRRETHCLDWRWKEEVAQGNFTDEELRAHCHLFYQTSALRLHPSCCTGDSTPSYLLDSRRVIPRLKQVFPWRISFLVLTRDPIQRAESHFAMVTSPIGTPAQLKTRGMEWREKSFAQVVQEEIQIMHDSGLIPYWNLTTRTCDQSLFQAFVDTPEEDQAWAIYLERHVPLNTGSYGLLARGLYALQLRPWLRSFDPQDFLCLQLERDLDTAMVQATMERVFDHVGVPSAFTLPDVSPKNTRLYEPNMDPGLYQVLQRFFEPHNQRWESLVASLPN